HDSATPAPLVFIFHGGGGAGNRMFGTSDMQEIAAREGFLIAYPDGARKKRDKRETWDIGRERERAENKNPDWDDIAFVRQMIAEIGAAHNIDPARIYAAGISRGGMF